MTAPAQPPVVLADWHNTSDSPLFSLQLEYSMDRLARYSEVDVRYTNDPEALKRMKQELTNIKKIIRAYVKAELAYSRKKNLSIYLESLRKCQRLIHQINCKLEPESGNYQADINARAHPDLPVVWLVFPMLKWLRSKVNEIRENKSGLLQEWIGEINGERLYWVFGGGLLSNVLGIIPAEMIRAGQASHELGYVAPINGYCSFLLYYLRFAIQLFFLCKHTIKNPLMTEKELEACQHSTMLSRFNREWQQRKFLLLNDSIWGAANMVCFFWLCGSGMKGMAGNYLTLGLLVFDLALVIWQSVESLREKNKQLAAIRAERSSILSKDKKDNTDQIKLAQLNRQELKIQEKWRFDRLVCLKSIAFSATLIAGFAMMILPVMPVPAMAIMVVALCGAALCFAAMIINGILTSSIEMARTRKEMNNNRKELKELVDAFLKDGIDDEQKHALFNEISQLDYQHRLAKSTMRYHLVTMIRNTMIDSMIPLVVFAGTALMASGAGMGLIAAAIAMAVGSTMLTNLIFKPRAKQAVEYSPEHVKALETELRKPESIEKRLKMAHQFFKKPKNYIEKQEASLLEEIPKEAL